MKMKNRWHIMWLWVAISALSMACGGPKEQWGATSWNPQDSGKVKVLSTTAMINDIVKQVGGDEVEAITLIYGQLNPHAYQLVKGDDEKLSEADIIFCSGLDLEHGASLKEYLASHKKVVALGDAIAKDRPGEIIHLDGQIDPHIWMDISLWSRIVPMIAEALSQHNPANAQLYHDRAAAVEKQMLLAHQSIRKEMEALPATARYLVTSHDAFNYFARAYLAEPHELLNGSWQERCVAPEGLAPEGQISALDIRNVIEHLEKYHITTLFPESNINKDSLKKIVEAGKQRGLEVRICEVQLYGDAMGPLGSEGSTYIGMIEHNANTMKRYWEQWYATKI